MDNTTHEVRLQQWYEIIQNQINSGQSKRNWCRENGISEKKFFYWQRRIRNEICKTKEHALELVKPGTPSTGFVEVPIAENTGNRLAEGFHPEAVISIIRESSQCIGDRYEKNLLCNNKTDIILFNVFIIDHL